MHKLLVITQVSLHLQKVTRVTGAQLSKCIMVKIGGSKLSQNGCISQKHVNIKKIKGEIYKFHENRGKFINFVETGGIQYASLS